ncbi:putative oxidoreductase [Anaerotaenia torta]|uniref:aldo/keto reductase n=1 Tax=Anaerotaenia torta TaxID=433293 RepID=UPI003D2341CF
MKRMEKQLPEQYLIYGIMGLGGSWEEDIPVSAQDIELGKTAIDAAIGCGIHYFDLADVYRAGKSDLVFGHYLKENPQIRERIIIQSKAGIRLTGTDFGARFDFSCEHIKNSVEGTLERLGTDYLDVLLLHRPDPLMDGQELKAALDELFLKEKIRALGASNMDYHQMKLIEACTGRRITVNQLELSLSKTDFISSGVGFNNRSGRNLDFPIGTLEYCMMNRVSLQSWGALAKGIYSGRPLDRTLPDTVHKTREIVERIAKDRKVSPEGVVLAWLMKHPAKIKPVIGSTNPKRIKNTTDAFKIQLTRDEWYELLVASRGMQMTEFYVKYPD